MIKQTLKLFPLISSLTTNLRNGYVIRYVPKRSPFDKTGYVEDWIPRQKLYHKNRKPRQP